MTGKELEKELTKFSRMLLKKYGMTVAGNFESNSSRIETTTIRIVDMKKAGK